MGSRAAEKVRDPSELPEKLRETFRLYEEEKLDRFEIADRMEVSPKTVENRLSQARKRLGITAPKARRQLYRSATEVTDPDKAIKAILWMLENGFGDNTRGMEQLAVSLGLPKTTVQKLLQRWQRKFLPLTLELRRVSADTLVKKAEQRVDQILDSISQRDLEKASLRDKAIAVGVLVDKARLLAGEATTIVTVETRKKVDELLPVAMKQLEARGYAIEYVDGKPRITRDVTPRAEAP